MEVKKIFRKNQLVLTLLAAMIAVAGYLTYADGENTANTSKQAVDNHVLTDLSENDILSEEVAREQSKVLETESEIESESAGEVFTDEIEPSTQVQPGESVLTSSKVTDYMAQVKLEREKNRSENKEVLNKIIDNKEISEDQKQSALDRLVHMTEVSELETQIENVLSTKGLEDTVVTIGDKNVDVVVGMTEITDAQRAQIEDVVKRKAEVSVDQIVISLMDANEK